MTQPVLLLFIGKFEGTSCEIKDTARRGMRICVKRKNAASDGRRCRIAVSGL